LLVTSGRQTHLVNRLVDGDQVDDPPNGAAFKGATQPSRRRPIAIVLAGLTVVAFALLARQIAPSAPVETTDVTSPPSQAAVVAPAEPVAAPAPPTVGPPERNPAATPNPTAIAVPAEAGEQALVPFGSTQARLSIALPDGWARAGEGMYAKSTGTGMAGVSISAWRLRSVNVFPCRWSAGEFADEALMRTTEGQALALASWWGQDPLMPPKSNAGISPIASKPRAVTVHGQSAWSVDVLIPSGLDLAECDAGQLVLWEAADGTTRTSVPGQLDRLWVVEIGGEVIVVDVASSSSTPEADVSELNAVVESIVIEP
jgi:hypothetical protein